MSDLDAPSGADIRQTSRGGHLGFAAWRDPATQMRNLDWLVAASAATLPWSTTIPTIFIVIWLVCLIPTLQWREFAHSLARPACALPLLFFVLALIGTLWSEGTWAEQQRSIEKVVKLLTIPLLIYHFERSQRGHWALFGFLISCILLMVLSYAELIAPGIKFLTNPTPGIPVKSYIAQSHEFTLCMFVLASPAITYLRQRRFALAAGCAGLMLAFFVNMMFVATARTALIYIPVLLILFMLLHLNARASTFLLAGAVVVATFVWFNSPYLRGRVADIAVEYQDFHNNEVSSTAERLMYWTKSLKFIREAPLIGHGTGSTMALFDREAEGHTGLMARVVSNPHNQTLNVAVQWGAVGVVLLYAMWLSHLFLFRWGGLPAWIGLVVVVQNIVSSLLNSHLFDFHEGWMYVLGVGILGGMTLRIRADAEAGRAGTLPLDSAAFGSGASGTHKTAGATRSSH